MIRRQPFIDKTTDSEYTEAFLRRLSRPNTDLYKYGYRFEKVLGQGIGRVGAFRDVKDKKLYAIKVMEKGRAMPGMTSEEFDQDVRKEHRNLARINSMALEKCDEAGQYLLKYVSLPSTDRRYHYFLSEVMASDLLQLFDTDSRLKDNVSSNVILAIICQLFHGLSCLHKIGIIHGDLKLENIFIAPNGQIKIGDFGGSASVDLESQELQESRELQEQQEVDKNESAYKTVLNYSPIYTAPEVQTAPQKFEVRNFQPKSDVWSLGIIILALTTKNLYIIKNNLASKLQSYIDDIINNIDSSNDNKKEIKERKDLLKHMLQKDPKFRMNIKQLTNSQTFKDLCELPIESSRKNAKEWETKQKTAKA